MCSPRGRFSLDRSSASFRTALILSVLSRLIAVLDGFDNPLDTTVRRHTDARVSAHSRQRRGGAAVRSSYTILLWLLLLLRGEIHNIMITVSRYRRRVFSFLLAFESFHELRVLGRWNVTKRFDSTRRRMNSKYFSTEYFHCTDLIATRQYNNMNSSLVSSDLKYAINVNGSFGLLTIRIFFICKNVNHVILCKLYRCLTTRLYD